MTHLHFREWKIEQKPDELRRKRKIRIDVYLLGSITFNASRVVTHKARILDQEWMNGRTNGKGRRRKNIL